MAGYNGDAAPGRFAAPGSGHVTSRNGEHAQAQERKSVSKDASVPLRQLTYPGSGALSDSEKASARDTEKEGLSFRVDLPSRRWLEQAAANGPAGR